MAMGKVQPLNLDAKATLEFNVDFTLDAANMKDENIREMDGWVKLMSGNAEVYRIPVLAIAHKLTDIEATQLVIHSTSKLDSEGALAELIMANKNANIGEALLFNMIGKEDDRKPKAESFMNSDCDLQSAGYKIVTRKNEKGENEDLLQVAIKLYKPMTTWHSCDVSLLIDSDGDGVPEQELLGSALTSIPGQKEADFATTLLDATKARALRKAYEKSLADAKDDAVKLAALKDTEDYSTAFIDQRGIALFNNSSVIVLEVVANKLSLTKDGAISFKVLVSHNEQSSVESDDYLQSTVDTDMRISLVKSDQAYIDLPESIMLGGVVSKSIELTKGAGPEDLMLLLPTNRFSQSNLHKDTQSQILKPIYQIK